MSGIDFVLEGLNHSLVMTDIGTLESISGELVDIEADVVATIDIKKTDIKKVFRFVTDASDIDDMDMYDIKYYVKMNNWPTNLIINPAHAILEPSSNDYDDHPDDRNMVKHDFVRYLADKLFGTHKGLDLMTNVSYLTYDIAKKSHNSGWLHIKETLENAFNSAEQAYYTNADSDASNNYTKQFLGQLINYYPERLSNLDSIMGNTYYSIPFEEGDSISFKTTIYPNPLQHNLTGVDPIGPRTYKIKMQVKEDNNVNTTEPSDKTFVRQTDYNKSYNYTDGFEEFVMPVIEDFQVAVSDTTITLVIGANTLNNVSIRLNAYDSNGNVIESFENLYIDISEENIPAFVSILNTSELSQTVSQYESTNGINNYKFEFVTNDDIDGNAFKTFLSTNMAGGYAITEL